MKDRRKEIMKYAEPLLAEQFLKSSDRTVQFCEERSKEMADTFLDACRTVTEQTAERQDNMEMDKVKYIQFSHLYSSMFLKHYLIRIDVMDQGFYNNTAQAVTYWNAENLYRLFETDIEEIKQTVEKSVLRICEYEVDFIRYAYAPYYTRMTKAFIQMMLEAVLSETKGILPETKGVLSEAKGVLSETKGTLSETKETLPDGRYLPGADRREEQVSVLFGEYMGAADLLFTLKGCE